jgi:GNAT superfamily N-acetyltransferase
MGRVFGFSPEMLEHLEADLPRRFDEAMRPDNLSRLYVARVDGAIVGAAVGWWGEAGVNLFGGAVDPGARGRGVYRALTAARWQVAVDRGTPALTVQAGKMSLPILARLGFEPVGQARLYVDALSAQR